LIYPEKEQTIREDTVLYEWHSVIDAKAYHLQVCRDPQMRWPYRPSLDIIYRNGTEYTMPAWGLYAPDTAYYWRVRTQDKNGFWGDWSDIQTFTWAGPRVPVEVSLEKTEQGYRLTWKPNPRGETPVAYEVYGSDLQGFPVHKQPFELWGGDLFPANYIGTTTDTQALVAGDAIAETPPPFVECPDNLNRCYYRVVAIDRHGVHSGCSDFAEMPHPFIISKPVVSARCGQSYSYQPQVISSLGDQQHRNQNPQEGLFFREKLSFLLIESPDWLEIDQKTGTLSGRIPHDAAGRHPVRLRVIASFEERIGDDAKDMPTPPDKIYDQNYILEIQ